MSSVLLSKQSAVSPDPADSRFSPTNQSFHRRNLSARELSVDELAAWQISESIVETVPESVARENLVRPLGEFGGRLMLAAADPEDLSTADKLRFILNRDVALVGAPREAVLQAIDNHYRCIECESADSVLQEFTDTKIDFTETEYATPLRCFASSPGALTLANIEPGAVRGPQHHCV